MGILMEKRIKELFGENKVEELNKIPKGLQPTYLAGSSNLSRESEDYYKTPTHATLALLKRENFVGTVWEPACGDGAISRLLPGTVISTDLFNHGYGETGIDFLSQVREVNHIVTNPPYRLAQEFVEHALQCVDGKVAMLLKLNFLEGQRRKNFFAVTPLRTIYVFSKRLSFDKGEVKGKGSGLLAYAWYVWEHGYVDNPMVKWI